MKNKKTKLSILLLLGFGLNNLYSQEATTASGGNAMGSGGTASYSIGQVVYTNNTSVSGSVGQGVLQVYEISVVTGLKDSALMLNLFVYPNPTSEILTLKVESSECEKLFYQILDINGKLLESKIIIDKTSTISMEHYANASYFIKVIQNNEEIKTFKIIKNN